MFIRCENRFINFNLDNDDKKDKETNKLLSFENLESYMPDDLVDESTNKILEQKMKKLNLLMSY